MFPARTEVVFNMLI